MQGWRSRPFWKKKLSNCCRKWRRVRGSWGGAGTALKGWVDGWTVGLWAIPSSRPEAWCEADPDKKGWQGEMEGEKEGVSCLLPAAPAAKSHQSCLTLCDPMDGSPPGSPVPGIFQPRTLGGLPFPSPTHESEKWKWSCSGVPDS